MAFFFLRFFLFFFFLIIFLKREFQQRSQLGISPKNLQEFFNKGAKWKKGSDPSVSALLFAISSFVGFSLWESLIISALDLFPFAQAGIPIGVVSVALLLRKRATFHLWTFEETLWAVATMGAFAGAVYCWFIFPWVYYRARFLKKTGHS